MQELTVDSNKQPKVNSICCYVCGREFGTKGFPFHYKECLLKYTNEQANKPTKDRIKLPDTPEDLKLILAGDFSGVDLKKFNNASSSLFKYKVLPGCKYCKRTFNAQSLAVHMKGCCKKPPGLEQKENDILINPKIPKALVCCVCGQRFGTASLRIHYPQCIKKFNNQEFRKHKKQTDRRRPPQYSPSDYQALQKLEWDDQELEAFNNRAMQNYRNHGMSQCDNCGRKFFFEQIDKHRKNCQLINGKLNLGKTKPDQKNEKVVCKPKTIVCYICGREYGTNSILIHIPQCQEMFVKQQETKAVGERKKMPQLSCQAKAQYDISKVNEWSKAQIESYNKLAFDCFNKRSLSKCYICQRTFFQEQLPKHLKDCQQKIKDVKKLQKFRKQVQSKKSFFGDNFIDNVIKLNKQLSQPHKKQTRKPRVLMCLLCGRQFGLSSLKIHVPQCRGQSSSKKLELEDVIQKIQLKYDLKDAQNWSDGKIQDYNKEVYQIYKKSSLFECKYCFRTFFEESLKKHIKHCQKEKGKKKGLRRCQTINDKLQQSKDNQSSLDLSITLVKNCSETIIDEEDEVGDEKYHALQYKNLLTDDLDEQQMEVSTYPTINSAETKPLENAMCFTQPVDGLPLPGQVLEVEDL